MTVLKETLDRARIYKIGWDAIPGMLNSWRRDNAELLVPKLPNLPDDAVVVGIWPNYM